MQFFVSSLTSFKEGVSPPLLLCKACIAIDVGIMWGNRGTGGDFPVYGYLILLFVNDLSINAWTPECVVHDTDPLKFTEFHLFPPDDQWEGNRNINVLTYISHICLKSDCNSTLPFEFPICLPLPVSHPCTSFPLATFKLCIVWFAHRTCYICVIFVFSGFKPSLIRKSQEVVSKNKWIGLD